MLPSGNDAAYSLAENLGKFLIRKSKNKPAQIKKVDTYRLKIFEDMVE